jgi:hypothetical protein
MTFNQQVLSSFMGTFFGLISAIIVFLITNAIKDHSSNKTLKRHLKREFEYNVSLLQDWMDEIDAILRQIAANDQAVFRYLRYTFFQKYFIAEAFRRGIMYNALGNDDMFNLNTILLHFDFGIEQYINSLIQSWQTGKVTQKDALSKFEFEKKEIQKYKKLLQEIVQKLDKQF